MAENHEVVRIGKLDEQTNYESGETGKCVRKLSENYGEQSEESQVFLVVPPSESRMISQKISVLRAQKYFPIIVGLISILLFILMYG